MSGGPIDAMTLAGEFELFQVVDVRYPDEWEAGHIDGAVHIPLDYVFERAEELDRSRPVVTLCRSGSRSAEAAKNLASEGFDVRNLEGGLEAWAAQGLPVVPAGGGPGSVVYPEPPKDERPEAMQRLQSDFLEVVFAVQEHFGDRQPSEQEVRGFLRQRMIDQGKTAAEADEFLTAMDPG